MRASAIVIGASGKIGGAIAEHLQAEFAVARPTRDELELTSPECIRRYFERFERIDLLVNAAGSYGELGRVRDVSPDAWRLALEINAVGVYACCHHALAHMPDGGHIVNLAGGGRGPMESRSGYAAAKSALWRFTETLATEEPQLRVNAIAPGPMDSRMQDPVVGFTAEWADFVRRMREGRGGDVPVENTLRVLDHILTARPTGQLFFAREFSARPALVSSR